MIAVSATYIAHRGWFKKVRGIVGAILLFTFIGGGIGSLIPMYMDGLAYDSASLSGILRSTGYVKGVLSNVVSSVLMDLPDKAITVLLVMLVIHLVPEKYYPNFDLHMWMQNPLSMEDVQDERKRRKNLRGVSLRTKAMLALGISMTTVAISGMLVSISVNDKTIVRDRIEYAEGVATMAAKEIDGDAVGDYIKYGEDADGYTETEDNLKVLLENSANISYLYVYQVQEGSCLVVFDLDTKNFAGEDAGTRVPLEQGLSKYIKTIEKSEEFNPVVTNDGYGRLLTSYAPVYDSDGTIVCYAGADVDMEQLEKDERSFIVEMLTMFLGFFLLLCTFIIWVMDYNIIFPIRTITENIDAFSFALDSQKEMDHKLQKFKQIDIHTGDEIEKMYHSLCQMTLNQVEQMCRIRKLSDSTAKMQNGLIITMADMVEKRDSDTGAHIQKTAEYVKIIVNGLKRKGYYLDILTPGFISDIVKSAPLHDIGKINISDSVLNKPGKLTEHEYEIMKTHTTHGKQIVEHVIDTVEEDSYLKEARNMAAFHHERWDGNGYPVGLRGELIPLSARIMAVADVFDALTSERVYKEAIPFDDALEIILEGAGTQFDPKCVEVFMESIEDVKAVYEKYNG